MKAPELACASFGRFSLGIPGELVNRRLKLLGQISHSAILRRHALGKLSALPMGAPDRTLADGPEPNVLSGLALSGGQDSDEPLDAKKSAAPSIASAGAAEGRGRRPGHEKVSQAKSDVNSANLADDLAQDWLQVLVFQAFLSLARRWEAMKTRLPGAKPYTDLNNADILANEYAEDLRFCESWDKWLWWDGRRWVAGKDSRVTQAAARLALVAMQEAEAVPVPNKDDPDFLKLSKIREESISAAKSMQSMQRISAMTRLVSRSSKIGVDPEDLDSDPWLFNAKNGTINLRTGELYEHKRDDLMCKIGGTDYRPDLDCPTWRTFIDDVTCGDQALAKYLQLVVGYCMTATVGERALFIFYGEGANGKGTFLRVLQEIMGDYAQPAPQGMLEEKHSDDHPSRVASLHGSRLVVCAEVERGRKLAESMVKDLTGGDKLAARRMREDFWYFYPTHKLILQGNYKPVIVGDDFGIWDRVRLIPWNARFSEAANNRIKNLYELLLEEAPAILAWAVQGCLEWRRDGLISPPAVERATLAFKREMDHIEQYVSERVRYVENSVIAREELYEDYEYWCSTNRYEPKSQTEFTRQARPHLEARGAVNTTERLARLKPYPVRAWRNIWWNNLENTPGAPPGAVDPPKLDS